MLEIVHNDNSDTNLCRYHVQSLTMQKYGFLTPSLLHCCQAVCNMRYQTYKPQSSLCQHFLSVNQQHRSLISCIRLHRKNNHYIHNILQRDMDKQQQHRHYMNNQHQLQSFQCYSIHPEQLRSDDICCMNMHQYHFLQHPKPESTCFVHQLEQSSFNNSLVNTYTWFHKTTSHRRIRLVIH